MRPQPASGRESSALTGPQVPASSPGAPSPPAPRTASSRRVQQGPARPRARASSPQTRRRWRPLAKHLRNYGRGPRRRRARRHPGAPGRTSSDPQRGVNRPPVPRTTAPAGDCAVLERGAPSVSPASPAPSGVVSSRLQQRALPLAVRPASAQPPRAHPTPRPRAPSLPGSTGPPADPTVPQDSGVDQEPARACPSQRTPRPISGPLGALLRVYCVCASRLALARQHCTRTAVEPPRDCCAADPAARPPRARTGPQARAPATQPPPGSQSRPQGCPGLPPPPLLRWRGQATRECGRRGGRRCSPERNNGANAGPGDAVGELPRLVAPVC